MNTGVKDLADSVTSNENDGVGAGSGFYADDVPFRSGVVWQQAPLHLAYIAALNGFNPPRPEGNFRYCDLACGNGATLNAFAALYPEAEFVGIDFNPEHIRDARSQADTLNLRNVEYIEGSFTDVDVESLPFFEFIGMNGAYSWLESDVRSSALSIVRHCLRPGGIFYAEYMCMPGMVAIIPLWHLMQALVPDRGDGSRARATRGLRLLEELTHSGMAYLDNHPTARGAARNYANSWRSNEYQIDHFAHNALASGFRPRFVTETANEMADAGLTFAGRTQIRLNDPDLAVTLQQAGILRGIEDRLLRELLSDYMRNERNRRDVFVKSDECDVEGAQAFLCDEVRLLYRNWPDVATPPLKAPGPRELTLTGPVYDRLRARFDGQAGTLAEADVGGEVSRDTLLTAGHRFASSGAFFLCHRDFKGGPLEAAPATLWVPERVNAERLGRAEETLSGTSMLARSVGSVLLNLGPLEVVLLNAWVRHGYGEALANALVILAESERSIYFGQTPVAASEVTADQLEPVLDQLAHVRVPNMVRMGALAACRG
jgi:hypothetical protein